MKLLLLLAIICSAYLYVEAAVSSELPNPKRKPGGCYSENTGHMLKDQLLTIPCICTLAYCHENGTISLASCPIDSESVRCKKEGDLSKPFPDCCPRTCF